LPSKSVAQAEHDAAIAAVGTHWFKKFAEPTAQTRTRRRRASPWCAARTAYVVMTCAKRCREKLASFKVPREFIAVERLPRNAMGKIQKHLLPKRMA
jgi:acyl-CoA synthetase (AMP-forming)/AMP-acid ligase II